MINVKMVDIARRYGKHINTVEKQFRNRGGLTLETFCELAFYYERQKKSKKQ